MMARSMYSFRKVTSGDLSLLRVWQSKPHVKKWWDANGSYDAPALADRRVARWIVSYERRPFAFMQDYTVHGWEDHHFANLPKGSRGIDQFIGEFSMVGAGHGKAFIKIRMEVIFCAGAPVIATDPHPDNTRAICVYEKLGFKFNGPVRETKWGLIQPMIAEFQQSEMQTSKEGLEN